jgi:glycine/D-amino acid oxidase-like deaminating enzyme
MAGAPARAQYDVVIAGGAAVGAATAFFLTRGPRPPRVLVVERDPGYARSSTMLSSASIRQQFSTPVNVAISQFGVAFLRDARGWLGADVPDLGFRENGYLVLAGPAGAETLAGMVAMQRGLGAETVLLEPAALARRFPWLRADDLGAGALGLSGEGWFDAAGLLQGLLRAARAQGAEIVADTVTGLERAGGRVTAAHLASGARIACGHVVNAAGPRAAQVAAMAGLSLPVEPRKRHSFVFSCPDAVRAPMPLVACPSGVYVRPEGSLFLTGGASEPDPAADPDDFDTDHELWESRLWPALAHRVPQFERARVETWWTGHYAMNTLDRNAVIGPAPELPNFLFANGFSGHGLQQAPAVGRGLAELIREGGYRSLDLSPLGAERLATGTPLSEAAVI